MRTKLMSKTLLAASVTAFVLAGAGGSAQAQKKLSLSKTISC